MEVVLGKEVAVMGVVLGKEVAVMGGWVGKQATGSLFATNPFRNNGTGKGTVTGWLS